LAGSRLLASLGREFVRPHLKLIAEQVAHICHPKLQGKLKFRGSRSAWAKKKKRPNLHNNQSKKGIGDVVQVADHLHSKYKALSSNPSTTKKEKGKNPYVLMIHRDNKYNVKIIIYTKGKRNLHLDTLYKN
jgi:hypothetical protein